MADQEKTADPGEQPVEQQPMNRAERRAAAQGKPSPQARAAPGHPSAGGSGGRAGPSNVPQHKRGTIRRKSGDG